MKKNTVFLLFFMAIQAIGLNAWSMFKSSSSQETSSSSAISSTEGGTVTIGDQTYEVEPGKTLQVSGGGTNIQMNTVQEDDKEPVTTVFIEESEPVAMINGKPAVPVAGPTRETDRAESEDHID